MIGAAFDFAIASDLCLHGCDFGFGGVLGGEGCCGGVEDLAHDVEFADGAWFQLGNDHALMGFVDKEAACLEAAERFADRGAAQSEALGKVGFLEAVAGLDRAFEDLCLKGFEDVRPGGFHRTSSSQIDFYVSHWQIVSNRIQTATN